ncbi:lariat debranching enzyme [Cylas formicarius]|uniref:lariat debranching enzyme n=1 Tax=Cylas formicarius TaxID=197179 RepID=UPI002958D018|nr:lariat debranching enzyme [Cylas formicarius]
MKIIVEGCAHGDLDTIYNSIKEIEEKEDVKIDLLICCGDFQSSRNYEDLKCMAVPPKYLNICSFYKYYSGEKKAPVLTVFIGGNHEASNFLQELPYGGWVAKNIYYLGYAGVINIAGIRIAGLSGIYKGRDFLRGRFEKAPYDENSKRSVYHIRNLEVFRLKQLSKPIDIFLSHDWPTGICNFGNKKQLLKRKPFFKEDIESGQLGSKPCEELLHLLKPKYWFSAHLHCKFAALVKHEDNCITKFLALDKCLPKRKFLQVIDVPHDDNETIEINYDLEWLTVLYLTNHLLNVKNVNNYMPGPGCSERYDFTPTVQEKEVVLKKLNGSLMVPKNFRPTAPAYRPNTPVKKSKKAKQPEAKLNPQTVEFCECLNMDDPVALISEKNGVNLSLDEDCDNTTFVDDSDSSGVSEEFHSALESAIITQEKILKKISLPEPKNKEQVGSTEVAEGDSADSSQPDGGEAPSTVDLKVCEENKAPTSPKRSMEATVGPKKFKRRNADIYTNSNDS